ncbi:MAG TPA: helix-turn-helix domain-containing protein [Solirubrobacteraceae bacterium]|jgi:transposase
MERERLELLLDERLSLEQLAARLRTEEAVVIFWLGAYDLEIPDPAKHAAKGGIERERLTALVDEGLSIAQIAGQVGLSKTTVRYWMKRFGLRSRNVRPPSIADEKRKAKAAGVNVINSVCHRHGETEFVLEGRGYYRCKTCRAEGISRHRRRLKETLASEAGGCCCVCGYDRYLGALAFHHLDPEQKRLGLACGGLTLSLQTLRAEAQKCILLCSNCHAEVEAGITDIPATVLRRQLEPG